MVRHLRDNNQPHRYSAETAIAVVKGLVAGKSDTSPTAGKFYMVWQDRTKVSSVVCSLRTRRCGRRSSAGTRNTMRYYGLKLWIEQRPGNRVWTTSVPTQSTRLEQPLRRRDRLRSPVAVSLVSDHLQPPGLLVLGVKARVGRALDRRRCRQQQRVPPGRWSRELRPTLTSPRVACHLPGSRSMCPRASQPVNPASERVAQPACRTWDSSPAAEVCWR